MRKPPLRPLDVGLVIAAVLAGVFLAVVSYAVQHQADRLGNTETRLDRTKEELKLEQRDSAALFRQVERLGAEPVVPVDPEPAPAPEPDRNPPWFGLDASEVRAIVADELGDRQLVLTAGQIDQIARAAASQVPEPQDGRSPTDAEVRTIVEDVVGEVCADDACRGPAGEDGQSAPPITNEQLDERLAVYCSTRNDCVGPQGPPGPPGRDGTNGTDGKDGAPGRGITAVSDPHAVDGNCVISISFDQEPLTQDIDVPESMCPLLGG